MGAAVALKKAPTQGGIVNLPVHSGRAPVRVELPPSFNTKGGNKGGGKAPPMPGLGSPSPGPGKSGGGMGGGGGRGWGDGPPQLNAGGAPVPVPNSPFTGESYGPDILGSITSTLGGAVETLAGYAGQAFDGLAQDWFGIDGDDAPRGGAAGSSIPTWMLVAGAAVLAFIIFRK